MLPRGAIAWAIVPFQPEAPFAVWRDGEVDEVATAVDLARRAGGRGASRSLTVLATAKVRPVVLLQDGPIGATAEVAALKLARLAKLPARLRGDIRGGLDPAFVPLGRPPAEYGLRTENAVDLAGVVRVHASAFATGSVGRLDARELAQIDRKLPGVWQIDVERYARQRVLEQWAALVAARTRGGTAPDR